MMDEATCNEEKKRIRRQVKNILGDISMGSFEQNSLFCINMLTSLEVFQSCSALSAYLSMPAEIQTYKIIDHAFKMNKRIFIPKIIGKSAGDMKMMEVFNYEEIVNFPKNNWNIPEPPMSLLDERVDGTDVGAIDLILLPGVAFDRNCGRVGHGKGYYDNFLEKVDRANILHGRPIPTKIGLALDEQIFDSVPMSSHDRYLDYVVTPTTIYRRPTY